MTAIVCFALLNVVNSVDNRTGSAWCNNISIAQNMTFLKQVHHRCFLPLLALVAILAAFPVYAEPAAAPDPGRIERLNNAKTLLERIKNKLQAPLAVQTAEKTKKKQDVAENIYPDGEELLFFVILPQRLKLDGVILARVEGGEFLFSLRDFADILEFPLTIDPEQNAASGWYIRENKTFTLSQSEGFAETDHGRFALTKNIVFDGSDIMVSAPQLAQWFNFELDARSASLELFLTPDMKLPLQERMERQKRKFRQSKLDPPKLPLGSKDYQLIDIPFVDVSTNSTYDKDGITKDSRTRHIANVQTAGDFARGTLSTQTQYTNEDQITNIRAQYKRASTEPELLGPLKARRYEIGDVVPTRLSLDSNLGQELGARITNVDPQRSFTKPTTTISGQTFPDWDVELYRENQLVGFQTVGDDGFYIFNDVVLFQSDNNFRLVFYGPQGEVREERLTIPVDLKRLAEREGVYDVSLTLDKRQTYRKNPIQSEDEGALNLMALYERPISGGMAGSIGIRSGQDEGTRNTVVHGGLSTALYGALINTNIAIDDELDIGAELVARRDFGKHKINNTLRWFDEGYDFVNTTDESSPGFVSNEFSVIGDLPFDIGRKSRYSFSSNVTDRTDDVTTTRTTGGINTAWKFLTFNTLMAYQTRNDLPDDLLTNSTTLTGNMGDSNIRLSTQYDLKPEKSLDSVIASYSYRLNKDLQFDLDLEKRIDPDLTEAAAQVNWQTEWARLSPRFSYNSDHDLFAGLSTRFGLAYDKQQNDLHFFNRPLTNNGGISALVFLDENGDNIFNEGEQPLEDVIVHSLHNGGREKTNEDGIALFTRLREQTLTDVFVDPESLPDPFWISDFEGISVLPREGYVAEVQFPIHISSEMDGTIYIRHENGVETPARNVALHLYDESGEIVKSANTDMGGFYFFSQIPPGSYTLLMDAKSAARNEFIRPKPKAIEIGYEGDLLYGQDVIVDAGRDIPSIITSDLSEYPYTLDLGTYKSKLLMTLMLYRIRKHHENLLAGATLLSSPDGEYSLRLALGDAGLEKAYKYCEKFIKNNIECTVEIHKNTEKTT